MKKCFLCILMVGGLFISGCTNADYDLSDIETTVRFNVDGLVVPMNIDNVTLKSVLDLKETSKVKEINGEYAIVDNGTFKSDLIKVQDFSTCVPSINPIEATLNLQQFLGVKSTKPTSMPLAYYALPDETTEFTISTDRVPEEIKDITDVKVDATASCRMQVNGLSDFLRQIRLENMKLQIMKGFNLSKIEVNGEPYAVTSYDPATGILDLSARQITTQQGVATISLTITGINAAQAGLRLSSPNLSIYSECHAIDGIVSVYEEDFKSISEITSLPSSITYRCDFNVSQIDVKSFSGRIAYRFSGFNIDSVRLNDIPDLLNQPETDIRITNPQIYIQCNNPLIQQGYPLKATMGFTLTANRPNEEPKDYSLDKGQLIVADKADNSFVISPIDPQEKAYPGREGATHVGFSELSNIFGGNGLPKTINVAAIDPQLPEQAVTDFRLGNSFNPVTGNYLFYAPLNLKTGTFISYADSIDGWNDEDVDGITIEKLSLDMNVTTDVSLDMNLTVYPIVIKNGKSVINYDISGKTHIPASASSCPVSASLDGTITHLDGIYIVATLSSKQDGKTLAPDMHINISDMKATVTGYYEKEL